jgi:hypothetical protein
VRITVVDEHLTAVAMYRDVGGEQIVDIRRDNMQDVRYEWCVVPDLVHAQLRELLASYTLRFAAIDFAVTPQGQWVFF